jgi:hypothetical protein
VFEHGNHSIRIFIFLACTYNVSISLYSIGRLVIDDFAAIRTEVKISKEGSL